jgi:hypothetical protein
VGVSDAVECLQLMVVAPSSVEVAVSDVGTATVEVRWKLEDDSGSVASGGSQSTRAPTAFVVRSKPVRHDRHNAHGALMPWNAGVQTVSVADCEGKGMFSITVRGLQRDKVCGCHCEPVTYVWVVGTL